MKRYKHDICGCAPLSPVHKVSDHSDPEFMFQFGLDTEADQSDTPPDPRGDHEGNRTPPPEVDDEDPADPKVSIITHRGEQEWVPVSEALKRYSLEVFDTDPTTERRKLRCIKCKLRVPVHRGSRTSAPWRCRLHWACIQIAKTGGGDPWQDQ